MSVVYLYALVDGEPSAPLGEGLAGEPLRLLLQRAVVGDLAASPPPDRPSLEAQDAVVRRLAEAFPAILPARFGESFADESLLAERLNSHAASLSQALARVRGCVQMTLRVFGEAEPVLEEKASLAGGPGARYLESRRRDLERSRSLPEIDPLRQALAPYLRAERIERRQAGPLLGTAYHLVPRERTGAYLAVLEEAGRALEGRKITASGPWPPYAFGPETP